MDPTALRLGISKQYESVWTLQLVRGDWSAMSGDDVFVLLHCCDGNSVSTSLRLCYQHTNGTLFTGYMAWFSDATRSPA